MYPGKSGLDFGMRRLVKSGGSSLVMYTVLSSGKLSKGWNPRSVASLTATGPRLAFVKSQERDPLLIAGV